MRRRGDGRPPSPHNAMADPILVANAGSSSIKFSSYDIDAGHTLRLAVKGQIDGIGTQPRLRVRDAQGGALTDQKYATGDVPDVSAAMAAVGGWLRSHLGGAWPVAVGHRVAHGGPDYAAPVKVDESVLAALERLGPLAPLHQPYNIGPIPSIPAPFPATPP